MRNLNSEPLFRPAGDSLSAGRQGVRSRFFWYAVLVICHLFCFLLVNEINALRPTSHLIDLRLPLDDAIPYLGWTWIIYYGGDVYFIALAAFLLHRLSAADFRRAVRAYILMIVGGASLQLLIPAQNCWPEFLHPVHAWILGGLDLKPFACLPSMHVALTVYPTLLGLSLLRSRTGKVAACLAALSITLSTVTLKQHVVLDVVAGVAWALLVYVYWLWGVRRPAAEHRGSP
jgi:membrane-associated phospholipid phosphatase